MDYYLELLKFLLFKEFGIFPVCNNRHKKFLIVSSVLFNCKGILCRNSSDGGENAVITTRKQETEKLV